MSARAGAWCAVLLVAACGGSVPMPVKDAGLPIDPDWAAAGLAVTPGMLGENTVWSRGGLGLWDDAAGAPNQAALAAVKELHPGALRFPGGTRAMRYHFDGAIGPVAGRTPQCDSFSGATDPTHFGLDEFLGLAADLGAEVTLVSPWVDGTPEEAAALIAYVDADPASTVAIGTDANGKDWGSAGSWAARRVANGHAASYKVEYLEIGNEEYLSLPAGPPVSCGRPGPFVQSERWVNGVRIVTTAADYAAEVKRTAALVHAVAPSVMVGAAADADYTGQLGAAAVVGDVDRAERNADPWNARLVKDAGGAFDFFVLHPYDFSTGDGRLELAERLRQAVHDLRALAPSTKVAVTEFGFYVGGNTLMNALASADLVRVAVEEQLVLALRHLLIEDVPSDPFALSAAILGPAHTLTPAYQALRLCARDLQAVAAPVTSPDPSLAVLATRDAGSQTLGIVLIDKRPDGAAGSRPISLALPPGSFSGQASTLSADSVQATSVALDEQAVSGSGRLRVTLPLHGLMVIALRAD